MKVTDNNHIVWNVYYPEPSSALTPEGILSRLLTVDGPGSGLDADFLDGSSSARFSLGNDGLVDASHPDYGVAGDGSDESAKLQAAFDAAAALRSGPGRPAVRIPPGKVVNIGAANLALPHGIDFDMRGSCLVSSAASGAALTIGADGYLNDDLMALGVCLARDFNAAGDPHLAADTIGVRFVNVYRPVVKMASVMGFRRCVQFRAAFGAAKQAGYCFEGHVFLSRMSGKYGLSLLNADKASEEFGAWVNAMRFKGGDFFQPFTATAGRTAGVIYEMGLDPAAMPLDGQALQNNVFDSPVFQLGGGGEPAFASGGTVPANHLGACYVDGGYSYQCTQSGTFGTTALSSLSQTPGASITSGTTTWTVEGKYVRSPFIFDRCGQSMACREPYWETGVGPFLHFIGKTAGSGHRVTGVFLGGPASNMTRLVGDRDGDRENWDWSAVDYPASFSKLNNVVEMAPQAGQTVQLTGSARQTVRSDNWHRRFIKGQSNWQAAGLAARYVDTLSAALAADYKIGDGCILTGGGGYSQFGVTVPTGQYQRFRVTVNHKSGESVFSGMVIVGFDERLVPISLNADPSRPPDIMADRGVVTACGSTNAMSTNRDNWEFWVAVADNIQYIHISNTWGHPGDAVDGIEVEAFLDSYLPRAKPLALKEPFSSAVEARRSDGTPTQGYFLTGGEYIINSTAGGTPDSVNGWVVAAAGILAPAWAAGTAVHLHELRSNGGNVYAANAAFVTGIGGPAGTGASIADGAGTWKYVAPVAVLSPVLQYRPHDPRADLDYAPYQSLTATLGTDSDADGKSDGVSTLPYGSQTGLTYAYSVSAHRQDFSITRGVGSDDGAGVRVAFATSMGDGKEYFLLIKGHASNPALPQVGFYVELLNGSYETFDISPTVYVPDGYTKSPAGQANGAGDIVLAYRFTAPAVNANQYAVSVLPAQWAYPAPPHTTSCRVTDLWLIDIAAAEILLAISLAGLGAGELYAIINAALTFVPPGGIRVTDTVTGLPKKITVANGVVTVV